MAQNPAAEETSQRKETEECPQSHTITTDEIDEAVEKTKSKSSAFISRVPKELRKVKESAYTPRLVSIGPLHSDNNDLLQSQSHMQDIKMSYVNSLFERMPEGNSKEVRSKVLEKCQKKMKKSIKKAKTYYAEDVDDKLNEDMLVIDGCFILELLYRYCDNKNSKESSTLKHKISTMGDVDPIFDRGPTRVAVQHDLLLLENQLPFFVLEILFSLTVNLIPNRSPCHSLSEYVISYFCNVMRLDCEEFNSDETSEEKTKEHAPCLPLLCSDAVDSAIGKGKGEGSNPTSEKYRKTSHILHLLHKHYLPRHDLKDQEKARIKFMHSASDLDYAGIKFVPRKGKDHFVGNFTEPEGLPWWFRRARFEIPKMYIFDSTEPFLRNLIAFEQCSPDVPCYVTSYAFLMDRLINSAKDIEVLEKAEVSRNYLGADEEASNLFNKLSKEVVLGETFYFAETCEKAARYSKRRWPSALAILRRNYFSTPWTFIGFWVALLLFGMSVTTFVRNFLR